MPVIVGDEYWQGEHQGGGGGRGTRGSDDTVAVVEHRTGEGGGLASALPPPASLYPHASSAYGSAGAGATRHGGELPGEEAAALGLGLVADELPDYGDAHDTAVGAGLGRHSHGLPHGRLGLRARVREMVVGHGEEGDRSVIRAAAAAHGPAPPGTQTRIEVEPHHGRADGIHGEAGW